MPMVSIRRLCRAVTACRHKRITRLAQGWRHRYVARGVPMTHRHVFSTPDIDVASQAMVAARAAGVEDKKILLAARSDIELEQIPDQRKEADTDMLPAAARGACYGAGAGLLAGLVAVAIPPLGVTMAGAAAATLAG